MGDLLQSETSMETTKENPLVRHWQLIVVLISLGVAAGSMQFQVNALAQEVSEQNNEIDDIEDSEAQTKTDVATIKVEVEAIKDDVGEIKDELKEQDKKLDRILEKLSE